MFPFKKRNQSLTNAELLLLSKFIKPRCSSDYDSDLWSQVLGNKTHKIISKFKKAELLEQPNLIQSLEAICSLKDLQNLARNSKLKVSGRKIEISQRLVEANLPEIQELANSKEVYVCTEKGLGITHEYAQREEAKYNTVENEIINHLKQGVASAKSIHFDRASQVVANYEAQQVFSRGLGEDWKNYDTGRDVKLLSSIAFRTPKLLAQMPENVLNQLRVPAALMYLWGKNDVRQWVGKDFDTNIHLDASAVARMLLFHAIFLENLSRYREVGVRKVKLLSPNDSRTCEYCKQMSDQIFGIESVPEIPLENCTCEVGCRTTTISIFGS